ncbi:hypothetical protein FND50_12635 [Rhodococcus sp. WB9]|uniref:hypothetical protein n=1 Tax=Rhodococcus sp. WB9 TaxID=2594007 RepID=UPI001184E031|nr:hypothetical protein [Rhodococcus sp. WB9]QDQ91580.1 hypothetical protein FND50_12635 [Rhodococcus sp. WB9]
MSAFIEGNGRYAFATDAPGHWAVSMYFDLDEAQAHQVRFMTSGHAGNARHHVLDLRAVVWDEASDMSDEERAMMLGADDDSPIM